MAKVFLRKSSVIELLRAPQIKKKSVVISFAKKFVFQYLLRWRVYYSIIHDGTNVGTIYAHRVRGKCFIIYAVKPEYRGKGYATDAVKLLTESLHLLGEEEIFASVRCPNPSSIKVLERNNYIMKYPTVEKHLFAPTEEKVVFSHKTKF